MEDEAPAEYLAECFWPDVHECDLAALDERAVVSAAQVSSRDEQVRYLGSLLILDDEVVLCRFHGTEDSVRRAARKAGIPYERILRATHSPRNSERP